MKNHLADKNQLEKMLQTLESDVDLLLISVKKIKEYFPKDSQKFYSSMKKSGDWIIHMKHPMI